MSSKFKVLILVLAYVVGITLYAVQGWSGQHLANHLSPLPPTSIPQSLVAEEVSVVHAAPVPLSTSAVSAHILMYHYIRGGIDPRKDGLGYRLSIAPTVLDQQIKMMQEAGYQPLSMADLAAGKGNKQSVVLTFDDGYEDFYTNAFPILQKYHWKATVYIITGKIGGPYMTWDQLKELKKAGMEIGAHTVNHRELNKLPLDQQRTEIVASKKTLEQNLGIPVTAFCYPVGRYNLDTVQLVKEAGFLTATTTNPGTAHIDSNPLLLPRLRISPSLSMPALKKSLAQS